MQSRQSLQDLDGKKERHMPNEHDKSSVTARGENAPVRSELDTFLKEVQQLAGSGADGGRGRIIFALDATMSRQPLWDTACKLQSDMFREVATAGGLEVQLVFYRGDNQCSASRWTADTQHLTKIMTGIACRAGHTQLRKVLAHAQKEAELLKVSALIFIGDALEEDEDELIPEARRLGRLGVPAFVFQEGHNREVENVFREIASLTRGAYCRFDPGAAQQLSELLRAVAVFATGGAAALAARKDAGAVKLLGQLNDR
jgi:hypothetical protein